MTSKDAKDVQPLDVLSVPHFGGHMVALPHKERGLLLAELAFLDPYDDGEFAATHSKAAFRSVEVLDGWKLSFTKVGKLKQKWTVESL